jgi:WD40 repeat protein
VIDTSFSQIATYISKRPKIPTGVGRSPSDDRRCPLIQRKELIMAKLRLLSVSDPPKLPKGEVFACCYTPDSQAVLAGGWDGHLRLWDVATGLPVFDVRCGEKPVSACAITPDGTQWLAGTLDGMLSRWDVESHQRLSTFLAHPRPISAILFAPDGQTLATAAWDRNVIVWHPQRKREGLTLPGHADIVAGCRFTPDGRGLLSWSYDGTLRLWDLDHVRCVATLAGHQDRVLCGAISPDGAFAASGGCDRVLRLWDLGGRRELGSWTLDGEIRSCCFLLDGSTLVAVEATGRLRLFALPDGQELMQLETGLGVQCAALAPSGGQLALGASDNRVHFVAIDEFDSAPLVITATQTSRRTANTWQRFLGKSQLIEAYLCTCPACRNSFELTPSHAAKQAPCPACRRNLRVSTVLGTGRQQ